MSRPAQLEKQMERVKELQDAMLQDDPAVNTTDPATVVDTPMEPVTPAAIEPPATVSKDEYDKLDQRYRTLQGMYNADQVRNRGEISNLHSTLQEMETKLAELQKASKPAAAAPTKYITDKDEEEYGDTLDMMRRAAREEAEAIAAKDRDALLERIAQLEAQTGQLRNTVVPTVESLSRAQSDQIKAEFWAAINTQVPDWKTINDTQEFKDWLLAKDPITGGNKQYFLDEASRDFDAPKVIRFFNEWKRIAAGGPTPAPNTAQDALERMVAPGPARSAPANPNEKKRWTNDEIGKFYADVNRGVYTNKVERDRIEADIFLAQQEGRVTK